jgi:recombinational DNA repair ATPase RecF
MKIEKIHIRNFKAIEEEELILNGNNVYVLGKNAVGKSSFIDAIFKIISGNDLPPQPTKQGEDRGYVQIDLGEYILNATFNSKNEKVSLSIESKEGAVFKSPRKMLNELAGVVDFNINDFFVMQPKDQINFIKKLVGIDFSDLDEEYKEAFEKRTYLNKKVKELKAQQTFFDKKKVIEKPIDTLQAQVKEIGEKNQQISKIETAIKSKRSRQETIVLERNQNTINYEAELQRIKDQYLDNQNKLIAEMALLVQEIDKGQSWLIKNKIVSIDTIQQEINDAIDFNKEVAINLLAQKKFKELTDAQNSANVADDKVREITETKSRIISEAKLPVPGLTFDDSQLYYNGLPFERNQINTAQQIIIGLQLNLALLNEIKIARFDGSLLDNENLALVEAWAAEEGLQLFVEFVDRNEENLKIEIQESNL